ncbi:hypothetical protein BDZ85DRAFT_92264 [Elsinoe ampelina]|uniref:Translation initiation factor IF-2 n=1 Tax=Elsinoe ampelina TaxID=302913 RepID=A0A6A6FZ81_9PEZI|nr:hypothetical protein BDZ85DRAFT_92264 [Elsinoe ampelina]
MKFSTLSTLTAAFLTTTALATPTKPHGAPFAIDRPGGGPGGPPAGAPFPTGIVPTGVSPGGAAPTGGPPSGSYGPPGGKKGGSGYQLRNKSHVGLDGLGPRGPSKGWKGWHGGNGGKGGHGGGRPTGTRPAGPRGTGY